MTDLNEYSGADWRRYREMSERLRAICVHAVNNCDGLPAEVVRQSEAIDQVRINTIDQSYIDFLDQQIDLRPRGQEWNDRLKNRRDKLAEHIDQELADCILRIDRDEYWIKIDPLSTTVVYWETYPAE